jgi:hypothetical protein
LFLANRKSQVVGLVKGWDAQRAADFHMDALYCIHEYEQRRMAPAITCIDSKMKQ